MEHPQPLTFTLDLADIDLDQLPADCRDVGTERFKQAVMLLYVREFEPIGGSVSVDVSDADVRVSWSPVGALQDPTDYAVGLLRRGNLEKGVALLDSVVRAAPTNQTALFNLGMALSDLGRLEEAQRHLRHLLTLAPAHASARVALGVAEQRAGDLEGARKTLEQAVRMDPDNLYAQRNLGAVLGKLGDLVAAEPHLRAALHLAPDDQASQYALARCLLDEGGPERVAEADRLLQDAIAGDAGSPVAEMARQARTEIAGRTLRAVGGDVRFDVVMYCVSALERFKGQDRAEIQRVTLEIALLGQRGLQVNNPEQQYTLRSITGAYSGLQLAAMMYVGMQLINPGVATGLDFAREYAAAQQLAGRAR